MLIQLSVQNFRSINNKVQFSMLATKDSHLLGNVCHRGSYDLLSSSLIIGENGAGKSNLLLAFSYFQNLLKYPNEHLICTPHQLSQKDQPTQIDIQFLVHETRYAYGFDVMTDQVVSEYLYRMDPHEEVLFERNQNDLGIACELYLTTLYKQGIHQEIQEVYHYLANEIFVIIQDEEMKNLRDVAMDIFQSDLEININRILREMNHGIRQFVKHDQQIFAKYDALEIPLLEESAGNQKLFTLLTLIISSLKSGNLILFDELEKSIHSVLVKKIINLFHQPKLNSKGAQLVFTTHQTSLLDLESFRKDQIWFMEKESKAQQTTLYSLTNFCDIHESEDIERGYLLGKYGAIHYVRGEDSHESSI